MAQSALMRGILRKTLSIGAGLAVAVAIYLLRWSGVLMGLPAGLFAGLLVLVLPVSSLLSRRILLSGAIFIGWVPVMWWKVPPIYPTDRVGLLLGLVSGGLVCWLLWSPDLRSRAKRLIPRLAAVDAMPFAFAGVAAWLTWPLLNSPSGVRTLGALMRMGWDHVGHTAMVLQIREVGAIVPNAGLPGDWTGWEFGSYPQHYHSTASALTELFKGPKYLGIPPEVLWSGRSMALVLVIVAALLAAGVAQLPAVRRRPVLAWPLCGLVVGIFLFGPGSWALYIKACPNWTLAAAAAGLAVLLAASMSGKLRLFHLLALGGLIVATVHNWFLLAPMAAFACIPAFVPLRRDRWPSTIWGWGGVATVVLLTVLASLAVYWFHFRGSNVTDALPADLDLLPPGLSKVSYLVAGGGLALSVAIAARVRTGSRELGGKAVALAGVSVGNILVVAAVGIYLLATAGKVSYYFEKLLVGTSLISYVVLAAGADLHVSETPSASSRGRKRLAVAASILATIGALMLFEPSGLAQKGVDMKQLVNEQWAPAERLLQASFVTRSLPYGKAVYVAALADDPQEIRAHQWQRALTGMWSWGSNVPAYPENWKWSSLGESVEWSKQLLRARPEMVVIVAPEVFTKFRSWLPPEMYDRVVTWGTP